MRRSATIQISNEHRVATIASFQRGFTIVELLIVIVVVSILAAITVVTYSGLQGRTNDVAVQSDLRNYGNKIQVFYATNGVFPRDLTDLESLAMKASRSSYDPNAGNLLYCAVSSGAQARFVIAGRSKSKNMFLYSSTGGGSTWSGAWTGAFSVDCPQYGIPTTEAGATWAQGYHPPGWGSPGWKSWD